MKYCESIFQTKRWKTREVFVGNVAIGSDHPIRIQSMTTSNTRDVEATVNQIIKLADWGCEIARVTVQGIKEAEACEQIKNSLVQKGYTIPLVADIHFFPPAALKVIDYADKVRINPGNFVDKRATFKTIEYDDLAYNKEIEKIEEKFSPLVLKCKKLKKTMRIGTNHGSLSDRIMNRYGDTPAGMVESAFEFARICRKQDFHDIIFSMKASNPLVMIQAYRLLVAEMMKLGWDYPLHLGVTEAGQGEDGRIKSAMGIGSLLLDGLGDTIRVSLTEDACDEIDPCKRLVHLAQNYQNKGIEPFEEKYRNWMEIQRRPLLFSKKTSLHRDGSVLLGVTKKDIEQPNFYKSIGCEVQFGKAKIKKSSVDSLVLMDQNLNLSDLKSIGIGILKPLTLNEAKLKIRTEKFTLHKENDPLVVIASAGDPAIKDLKPDLLIFRPITSVVHAARQFFNWLSEFEIHTPVILNFSYSCSPEDLIIQASTECGSLLCDGLGEGLWLQGPYELEFLRNLSFNILQAARMRTFKTDFISCPSCGRTLFDLQEVTKRIRSRTSHLPGVKIAIMGCIVNGPGEMADADFGYVGSKPEMIDLYIGKKCVEKDIPFSQADDRLIELIKSQGRWSDPSN